MASDLSAGVRVPSMHPYRWPAAYQPPSMSREVSPMEPAGMKIVMHLSAIMYEPVIWYRCIRVPDGVKMASDLSAIMYEPAGVFLVSMHP